MTSIRSLMLLLTTLGLAASITGVAAAQDAATAPSSITPVPRDNAGAIARQDECIRRVRESEPTRVLFVGDSITQSWEGPGREVWKESIAPLGALNLGNSGDRTEHVLWRLKEAPLTRLAPEHVVLLIGTNNLGHGTSTAAETFDGIRAVIMMLQAQCPEATIHIIETFPRGEAMNPMRGDICQINQALGRWVAASNDRFEESGKGRPLVVHDFGDAFVIEDGRIPRDLMPDFLHLTPKAYEIWAEAIVPAIK
jgi:lysophospholipase L1-like esterase